MELAVLIKDTVPLSQFLPSSLGELPILLMCSCHGPFIPQPSVMGLLWHFSIQPALPITCQLSQKSDSDAPPSWVPICFGGLHPLSIPVVSHACDLPAPLPLPSLDNGSHRWAQRLCLASRAGEPVSAALGLGTFLGFEASLSVHQWDRFS